MVALLVFWLLVFGALATGWQAGDRDDRKAILWIASAAILSTASSVSFDFRLATTAVGVIDTALLIAIISYALRTSRYWPIWFAGFHTVGLTLNILKLVVPNEYAYGFGLMAGLWGVAALTAMVVGLLADQKAGFVSKSTEPTS